MGRQMPAAVPRQTLLPISSLSPVNPNLSRSPCLLIPYLSYRPLQPNLPVIAVPPLPSDGTVPRTTITRVFSMTPTQGLNIRVKEPFT